MDPLPPGFRWPDGVRAAAMFTFDVDAEAVMLIDHPETADYLDVMAHQRYGPQVAVPRLLRMLDRLRLRTTFFIPGWVAETWPDVARSGDEANLAACSTRDLSGVVSVGVLPRRCSGYRRRIGRRIAR